MKLKEVLDPRIMADRINLLKKDKTENTKTLVKLLRQKAAKRRERPSDNHKFNKRGAEDSFTSYVDNTSPI